MKILKPGAILLGLVFLLDRWFKMASLQAKLGWLVQPATFNYKAISGLFLNQPIIVVLGLAILIFLIFCWQQRPNERIWLSWVILGAASNIFDRLVYGGVIDYWGGSWWPWVFNLADIMIIGGLGWYLIKQYLAKR